MILTAIKPEGEIIGYFGCLYSDRIFEDSFRNLKKHIAIISAVIALLEAAALATFVRVTRDDKWK